MIYKPINEVRGVTERKCVFFSFCIDTTSTTMKLSSNLNSPVTPDASSAHRTFDAFQRSKVGSIRDNPKLSKIRQRFENASQESQLDDVSRISPKNFKMVSPSYSAPCSLNFIFPASKDRVSPLRNIGEISLASLRSNGRESRRHSEGEVGTKGFDYPMRRSHSRVNSLGTTKECKLSSRHDSGTFSIATEDGDCCSSDELSKSDNKDFVVSEKIAPSNKQRTGEENCPPKYEDHSRKSVPTTIKHTGDYYTRITDRFPQCTHEKSSCAATNSNQKIPESLELSVSRAFKGPKTLTNSTAYAVALRPEKIAQETHGPAAAVANVNSKKPSCTGSPTSCERLPTSPTAKTPQITVKKNSVRNAVRLYEEMSCKGNAVRSETPKIETNQPPPTPKRLGSVKTGGDCISKKASCVIRRPSRKNSVRKAKAAVVRSDSKKGSNPAVKKKSTETSVGDEKHPAEDSGLYLSDTDDQKSNNAQGIYQTLCGINNHARDFDPYDRLNRIHDMVSRIHKGQLAACAACKAIPSNTLRYAPVAGISLLQVRCNEVLPHHHPPCVCFSCQHSIFSCSQAREDDDETPETSLDFLSIPDSQQNLYYNACCLEDDTPSPETWRLARRKPVCERNGRVCVVNCGVDQSAITSDEFYEKLTEWQSAPLTSFRRNHDSVEGANTKLFSGDSCDSDEGWVDITDDSEEEKLHPTAGEQYNTSCKLRSRSSFKKVCEQHTGKGNALDNASYDLQTNNTESMHGDNISRVSSSEHLYETISDIEEQNRKLEMSKEQEDPTLLNKLNGESALDNEHDSGEWSTESPSPILDETCDACEDEKCLSFASSTCPATRFNVSCELEAQESKSTFIKSMLGKKTVSPKKRRMSHFFVPWLVSNQEYGSSQSPKPCLLKKQNMRAKRMDSSPPKAKRSFTKTKRSQSVTSKSCDKAVYSSTGKTKCSQESVASIETGEADETNSVEHLSVSGENLHTISQSNSFTSSSSAYVRTDQLKCNPRVIKPAPCASPDTPVDVVMERVRWRSLSGDSDHSYILFQPIKEEDVPLYQFYERNIKERVALCRSPDSFSPIMWPSVSESNSSHDCGHKSPAVRSQLSVIEQLSPDTIDGKMLWCELPEVKDSGILGRISAQELKLQEAVFELIQSQASYVRSLKVLYEYFILSPEFSETQSSRCVLSKHEHDVLFSDIIQVKEVSEMLMTELTTRWSDGILIPDICDILYKHSTMTSFSVYVKYCSNRVYQEKTLKELKETRLCFMEVLRKLESNPACQGLSLESFLFLPMQHIARLPLLLDSIFRWLTSESPSYDICKNALEAVHKTFMECNEGAKRMERLEEMLVLNKQLEFKECKAIPLISTSRWLLKKGEMMKLEFDKKTFGRSSRCVRVPLYFFLFNDFIVITKRKSEDCYIVVDYCQKEKIQASTIDAKDLPQSVLVPNTCRYLIHLSLFCNHQGSSVDMILNCPLLSERTRWIEAIHPVPQGSSHEVWDYDCPQVQCVRTYIAQQPDELSLQESDVVTIQRKMNDGWYEGRRLRDGLQGWFPASYTMDIPCCRARASNLRQCYRLLMLSQKHHGKS